MKKKITRKLSVLLALTTMLTAISSLTAFAFDNGYRYAVEFTTNTGNIEMTTDNEWYSFTITDSDIPCPYSLNLSMPEDCMYNFDLHYRGANDTGRPVVVSNETIVASNGRRYMYGVFTQAGTYFVRVYSQNGYINDAETYKVTLSKSKNSNKSFVFNYALNSDATRPASESADGVICADMLGNHAFSSNFPNAAITRNYKNAGAFIITDYSSDSTSEYNTSKQYAVDEIVTAANYIYSGYLMQQPKFVSETKIYSIIELMQFLWTYSQPVIFYVESAPLGTYKFQRYAILQKVNLGENTITYYYPADGSSTTVDYDTFLTNGITFSGIPMPYTGVNILQSNYRRMNQAIYN